MTLDQLHYWYCKSLSDYFHETGEGSDPELNVAYRHAVELFMIEIYYHMKDQETP